ncbi:MAG: ASCH domain-containing protein [Magnetococcales bacterium]|nr:ASCH domain-containing protein [Magnetococcales bacterium]
MLSIRPPQLTDDRTVLISIHPSYVKKILSGEKRLEFRRRWASGPVDKLVIYSTAPVKKLVATARVEQVITGTKNELWERAKHVGGGVTEDELFRYLDGKEIAVAIELSEITPFSPLDPKTVFGSDFTPPQSFRFLKPNEMDQLLQGIG